MNLKASIMAIIYVTVLEQADKAVSKTVARNSVWVQVPSVTPARKGNNACFIVYFIFFAKYGRLNFIITSNFIIFAKNFLAH